jgi:hypothetical protein
MARETFIEQKFRAATLAVIEQANTIIAEYWDQGFVLTLRQLFYQFVARALIENTYLQYKRLGTIVGDARDAGLIDWEAIEDRTRNLRTHSAWNDPADIIESAAEGYREDLWAGQTYRLEVWIEKAALIGVIEGVCTEFRVPHYATLGNGSKTELYKAGKRFADYLDQGLIPVVLHLADHDPNGIDMTRDIHNRLALYAGRVVEVRRIALNLDQVEQYRPPPNFAKEADSRYAGYVRQFGTTECWELDALSPTVTRSRRSSMRHRGIRPGPKNSATSGCLSARRQIGPGSKSSCAGAGADRAGGRGRGEVARRRVQKGRS